MKEMKDCSLPPQPVERVAGQVDLSETEVMLVLDHSVRTDDIAFEDDEEAVRACEVFAKAIVRYFGESTCQHPQPKAVATVPTWEEIGAAYDHGVINGKQGTWQHRNGLEGIVALLTSRQEGL